MRQTAVEYLAKELYERFEMKDDGNLFNEILEQVKEMEIEQLKNIWKSLDTNMRNQFSSSEYKAITLNEWFKNK